MPQKDLTAIIFVLDQSSSMNLVKGATISGFNEFLQSQREVPGEVLFSLTLFDTRMEPRLTNVRIDNVSPLTDRTYTPAGMTALYDAVGATIDRVGKEFDGLPEGSKPEKVIMVIQTDGQENSSREYSAEKVKALIEQQKNEWQWEFLFLGADQNAWEGAGKIGIPMAAAISYDNTEIGTQSMYATLNSVTTNFRKAGVSVVDNDLDRDLRDHSAMQKKAKEAKEKAERIAKGL